MPAHAFVYQPFAQRVVFGTGTLSKVGEETARLGIHRPLVIATPGRASEARRLAALLGNRAATVFAGAEMHTPTAVTKRAMAVVAAEKIDGTIALGGGSTTGLGKAIAWRTDLPQLVIPTTYAGSEMTDILGETDGGGKKTVRDPRIVPETVLYDVALTLGLPVGVSVTSAMNAIAHAVEGLYAVDGNPVASLMAEESIRSFATAIPAIVDDPRNIVARSDALYGAWLAGSVLGTTSMALHHKLCHVLGGSFGLPHAETHTVVLPHAVAYNAGHAPIAMARIGQALGRTDVAAGLYDLASEAGAPTALRDLGMAEAALDRAADLAAASPYANPRPIGRDAIRALLDDAWHGRRPE